MESLTVLSLFDGMSCGQIALNKLGITNYTYYASEIKEHAKEVTQKNYPNTIQLGSVTSVKSCNLPKIDLLIGGSPCQDFSRANAERLGDKGEKSGLFYEYVRILRETNPKYFLLENVIMKKEHEKIITEILGVEPVKINSSLVSPSLRNRLYWTNIPNDGQPNDEGLKLNDFLTEGFSDREKARCLLESDSRPLRDPVKMCHRHFNKGFNTPIFKSKEQYLKIKEHFDNNFKNKSAKDIGELADEMDLSFYNGLRYMNKEEREACQGIPKNYTIDLTENEGACLMGDGWNVDTIAHLLKNIIQKE